MPKLVISVGARHDLPFRLKDGDTVVADFAWLAHAKAFSALLTAAQRVAAERCRCGDHADEVVIGISESEISSDR